MPSLGGDHGAGETPLDQLAPDPVSLSELGDGSSAVALLQEAQLL